MARTPLVRATQPVLGHIRPHDSLRDFLSVFGIAATSCPICVMTSTNFCRASSVTHDGIR